MPREGDNKCIACARRRSWGLRPTDIKPHRGSKEEPPKEESQKDATKDSSDEDDKPVDDRFYATWDKFTKKRPSIKSTSTIKNLDHDLDGKHKRAPGRNPNGLASRQNAATSFEEAAETCRRKVRAIVDECKRLNKKYHDPMFDLRGNNSLVSLTGWVHEQYDISAYRLKGGVADVKRVGVSCQCLPGLRVILTICSARTYSTNLISSRTAQTPTVFVRDRRETAGSLPLSQHWSVFLTE